MTFADRVAAIEALGFTARQAAFLTPVALHSGYCLRRQYAAFTDQKYGKNVCDFFDSLVESRVARRLTFRADRGSIYHLFARRVYAALGEEDNRNRRHSSPPLMARKLMLLDFVLSKPNVDWYATETEKRNLFVHRLGIPENALPHRTYTPRAALPRRTVGTTRYLVQKLPIFLSGDPPSVHFVCPVTDPEATAIGAFVREHLSLLRHLPAWTLHAAVPRNGATHGACVQAYERARRAASLVSLSEEDLAWFRRTGERVEEGQFTAVTVDDLRRYRELSSKIARMPAHALDGRFVVASLGHGYEQFGSLLRVGA